MLDNSHASDASPSDRSESEFGGSANDSEDALTDLSSDGESAFEDEVPAPSARGKGKAPFTGKSKAKAAPRTSTASAKSKANGKSATSKTKSAETTKAFAGKGRTLAEMASDGSDYTGSGASDSDASVGSDDEDAGDDVDMAEEDFGALDDDETRIMTMMEMKRRRRENRKAYNKGMESIRKEEAKMKKKLGRKLTNGEKNIIRLVKVSCHNGCLFWSV